MKRTINLVGQNTLTVSLPSEFVKKQGLKKGQEIEVEEEGSELVIRTKKKIELEKKVLKAEEIKLIARRYINALNRKGIDEIEISYENEKDLEEVKKALKKELSTYEIVKKSDGICLIKSISELDEKEFDNLLRRTLILLKEMVSVLGEAYKEKDKNKLKEILELEELNNRLTCLLRRALNKKGHKDHKNTILYYLILDQLEKAADELRDFSLICDLKVKGTSELISSLERLSQEFYDLFYSYSSTNVSKFELNSREFIAKNQKLIKKLDPLEVHHLLSFCEIIFNLSASITSINS